MKETKIYCFSDKATFETKLDSLYPNVIWLKNEYELLNNNLEKIIVYDPDFAGWKFPNQILRYKNIKGICLGTTTKDYIDESMCRRLNIPILNIPKYSTDSVAEYMTMLMFAIAKKIPLQIKNNFKQDFDEKYTQIQLFGKNVGIVGLGNIGLRFAQICSGIGMKVSYWNRTQKETSFEYKDLSALFKDSDVILVALQINEQTKKIITSEILSQLKPTAILLSIGGMNLFDHSFVLKLIQEKKLFGYGLEIENKGVFDFVGNTMVTSEYAWFTKESQEKRIELWIDNIKSLL